MNDSTSGENFTNCTKAMGIVKEVNDIWRMPYYDYNHIFAWNINGFSDNLELR